MKKISFAAFCFPLIWLISSSGVMKRTALSGEDEKTGVVTHVFDGDTISVLLDEGIKRKVRLIGIDTPEFGDSRPRIRFYALAAQRFVFHHLYRKKVAMTFDHPYEDKYGRLLAYIWTPEGELFNRKIVDRGFGAVFRKFSFARMESFEKAEKDARNNGRGFWRASPYPVIRPDQAVDFVGKIVSVRFRCLSVRKSPRYQYLQSAAGAFTAVVSRKGSMNASWIETFRNRDIVVTGYLEEYRGMPQIMVIMEQQFNSLFSFQPLALLPPRLAL